MTIFFPVFPFDAPGNRKSKMAASDGIKEIGLELDRKLNTVLEKNQRIKENIRENIKEKNLEVLRVISKTSILVNVDSDLLDNSDALLTLERLVD